MCLQVNLSLSKLSSLRRARPLSQIWCRLDPLLEDNSVPLWNLCKSHHNRWETSHCRFIRVKPSEDYNFANFNLTLFRFLQHQSLASMISAGHVLKTIGVQGTKSVAGQSKFLISWDFLFFNLNKSICSRNPNSDNSVPARWHQWHAHKTIAEHSKQNRRHLWVWWNHFVATQCQNCDSVACKYQDCCPCGQSGALQGYNPYWIPSHCFFCWQTCRYCCQQCTKIIYFSNPGPLAQEATGGSRLFCWIVSQIIDAAVQTHKPAVEIYFKNENYLSVGVVLVQVKAPPFRLLTVARDVSLKRAEKACATSQRKCAKRWGEKAPQVTTKSLTNSWLNSQIQLIASVHQTR